MKFFKLNWFILGGFVLALGAAAALADDATDLPPFPNAPVCVGFNTKQPLPVNNSEVLHWKKEPNQFQERGHITGPITQIYRDKTNHKHFAVQIGRKPGDIIEVIYNEDFGRLPQIRAGMAVEACGDFIVSKAPSGKYPKSPADAILHWVHATNNPTRHASGFLILDGNLFGQDVDGAGPKPNRGFMPQGFGVAGSPLSGEAASRLDRIYHHPKILSVVRGVRTRVNGDCYPEPPESIVWNCMNPSECRYIFRVRCGDDDVEPGVRTLFIRGFDNGAMNRVESIQVLQH